MSEALDILQRCIDAAKQQGADAADGLLCDSRDVTVRQRMGKPETIERAESQELGLRALVQDKEGYRQAIVSSNDFSKEALDDLVARVVEMAKNAPADPYISLADTALLADTVAALDICDAATPDEEALKAAASACEEAALAVDGVTNSEGAEVHFSRDTVTLVTSDGFAHGYDSTNGSVMASVIAGEGTAMETDYAYTVARHWGDMRAAAAVGEEAGTRAVKRLGPKKVQTCQVPVVFEPRVARSLVGSFASAINGASVARGTSFLQERMGEQVFAAGVEIIDDPLRARGIASEPFDGEGVKGEKRHLVEKGVLKSWLLDTRSARQLGLTSTGHAARGTGGPPHPASSNLYMAAGEATPEELVGDIADGFYVTEAFGMGVNGVTGDYSQGASGFWITGGEITHAVSELTIAGNLKEMFLQLTPANDLRLEYGTNAPSVRIEGMTVAGT